MSAKAIRNYLKQLNRRDEAAQLDAMDALGRYGPLAFEAIPKLGKLLDTYNPCIKSRAANALGRMGPVAAESLTQLLDLLSDSSPSVRSNVLRAINRIGPVALPDLLNSFLYDSASAKVQAAQAMAALGADAQVAVPDLTRALSTRESTVRVQAARTLASLDASIDPFIPNIISILKKHDEMDRPRLAESLAKFPKIAKAAVPILLKLLEKEPKDKHKDPRPAAIQALGKLGAVASAAIPQLMTFITGEDNPLRSATIVAIGRMGPAAAAVVPDFIAILPTAGDKRTILLVEALGRIGPDASSSVPQLLHLLTNAYGELRESLMTALASMGTKAAAAIPNLVAMLNDRNAGVRADAIHALRQLGPVDPTVISSLSAALADPEVSVRRAAMEALAAAPKLGATTLQIVQKRLEDRDAVVRQLAATLLGRQSFQDALMLERYREALQSPHQMVRFEAAEVLWLLTGDATASLPVLRESIVDNDRAVRHRALELLKAIASTHSEAMAVLIQALRNPDEPLGRPAANALIAFGPAAILALRSALNDPTPTVLSGALYVLGRLGEAAKVAVSEIVAALDDAEPDVRWAAARAVGILQPETSTVVAKLTGLLGDESATVRGWAVIALAQLGPDVVPSIIPVLSKGTPHAQAAGCEVLAKIGPPALEAVAHVGPLLREENAKIQLWANRAIDAMCRDIQAEVEPYLKLLGNPPRAFQEWAAFSLAERGSQVVPLLLKMMGDENDEDFVWGASETLTLIGPAAEPATPLLIRALEDEMDVEVQDRVARALAAIGQDAVPLLAAAMNEKSPSIRIGVIDALSRMGPAARESAPGLVGILAQERNAGMQRFLAETIGEIGDTGVAELIRAVEQATEIPNRARLIHALGVIGPRAQAAETTLLANIEHSDPDIRVEVIWSLGRIPPTAENLPAVLNALAESLTSTESRIREQAALTLGRLKHLALPGCAKILPALSDSEPSIRLAAAFALGEVARNTRGKAELTQQASLWLTTLQPLAEQDPDAQVRGHAVRTLAALPLLPKVIPIVQRALQDPSVIVQLRAVDSLEYLGGEGEALLRQSLSHHNPMIRRIAINTLMSIRPRDLMAILGEKLSDPDWFVASRAAKELSDAKENARSAIPAMIRALRSPVADVRITVLKSLKEFDPEGQQIIPGVMEAMVEKNESVRAWACETIGTYREKAAPAISLLIVLSGEMVPNVSWRSFTTTATHAGNAIRAIGSPAIPFIQQAIQQPNETLRLRAFDAMERYHHSGYQLLKPYRKQLGSPPPDVREKIEEAFSDFAVTSVAGVPGLLAKLQNRQDWRARWEGAIGLGELAKQGKLPESEIPDLVAALRKATEDNDFDVREKSVEALGLIGPPASSAADRVIELIGDQITKVRLAAIAAAGRLGESGIKPDKLIKMLNLKKHGAEVVRVVLEIFSRGSTKSSKLLEAVLACLKSKDPGIRVWTAWCLSSFGGKNKEARAAVEKLLEEPHPRVRAWAAAAHARMTKKPDLALPVIRSVLICRDEDTRRGVLVACREMGQPAIPMLLSATADPHPAMRREAAHVGSKLPEWSDALRPALERLANTDLVQEVREAAVAALKTLETPVTGKIVAMVPANQ